MDLEAIWEQAFSQSKIKEKEIKEKKCCQDFYLVENEGHFACLNCGVITGEVIFDGNIFSFNNGENNMYLRSAGANELYPISSQSTYIAGNSRIARLNTWNSMPYNERVIWEISNDLKSRLQDKVSQRVLSETLSMYKAFYEKSGIYRGENKRGFVAVCLYVSLMSNFATNTPKEIARLMDVDIKVLYKCIQKYSEIMGTVEAVKPISFIENFSNKVGISFKIRKVVIKILNSLEKYKILDGVTPQNVCISVILFVCNEMKLKLNIELITKEFLISNVTIEKVLAILKKNKQQIFKSIQSQSKQL
jgi:transcription initiation factor TFIIIB Brf1 subunit/transcription initiation factor TFIIB